MNLRLTLSSEDRQWSAFDRAMECLTGLSNHHTLVVTDDALWVEDESGEHIEVPFERQDVEDAVVMTDLLYWLNDTFKSQERFYAIPLGKVRW